jgi:hypothetical protein
VDLARAVGINGKVDALDLTGAMLDRARSKVERLGMGMGTYESMKSRGIRPVVTDIIGIDEAVLACVNEQIIDHVEKLH